MADKKQLRRRAGIIGTVVGVVATGVAVGVAAERIVRRRRRTPELEDPLAGEVFGELPYDESLTVPMPEGIDLYVEIVDAVDGVGLDLDLVPAGDPEPTLVFVHGFCLDMGTFHFQRISLARDGNYRMVFYDQPGHGRSGKLTHGEYTLDYLAEGLKRVIDETVPDGPIVLVGHSMGGMTIMALAEQYPDLFGARVKGVVLASTSAGKLDEVNFGLPDFAARFAKPLMPVVIGGGKLTSGVIDNIRQSATDLAWLLTRRYGFGSRTPSAALVSYVEQMNSRTGTEVVARYLRTIYTHARYPALEALKRIRALVICGEDDKVTPPAHSAEICRILPDAAFLAVPGAGHVALLERPDVVNPVLMEFLEQIY
jgi:pimeloyl-ACP methyl ester carboxylesterase